jgi:microcystin-dependent protein
LGAIVALHYPDNTFSSPPNDTNIAALLGSGWKLCDGAVINDTSSPFNGQTVPNLNGNGNYIQGSHSYLDTPVSGGGQHITIGSNSLEMPAHSHGMSNSGNNGSHSHATPGGRGYVRRTGQGERKTAQYGDVTVGEPRLLGYNSVPRSDITAGAHHHDLYASGSSAQHNNLPRTFQVVYVMRIR